MKIFLLISATVFKVVCFVFIIVFNNTLYEPLTLILLPTIFVISAVVTTCFFFCYCQNLKHKEINSLFRVAIMSFVETCALGLFLAQFLTLNTIDAFGFLWFVPFVVTIYWCLPKYSSFKKRNG